MLISDFGISPSFLMCVGDGDSRWSSKSARSCTCASSISPKVPLMPVIIYVRHLARWPYFCFALARLPFGTLLCAMMSKELVVFSSIDMIAGDSCKSILSSASTTMALPAITSVLAIRREYFSIKRYC